MTTNNNGFRPESHQRTFTIGVSLGIAIGLAMSGHVTLATLFGAFGIILLAHQQHART